ncbi:igE-binding protein-like [Cynocephalus volans]|uniref:igE-binding protein-like n=1 Tax=Cynocephalus volans TaxID=110931 RepID=UPI002FC84492
MGSTQSTISALDAVLSQRGIKVGNCVLKNFVKEVDRVAPWYACSGSLTLTSWNKLGRDLDRKYLEGDLRQGTKTIWKFVKNCLEDEGCRLVVTEGQNTLEEVQDSMSESERSERMGTRKRRDVSYKEKDPPGESTDKGVKTEKGPPGKSADEGVIYNPSEVQKKRGGPYPVEDLEALNIGESDSDSLDSSEESDLEEEAARYEEERYHPDGWRRPFRKQEKRPPPMAPARAAPSAPPPPPYEGRSNPLSFLPDKVRRKVQAAFPVFEVEGGGRIHAPVEYSQIKDLAEAVRKYGVNANFTVVMLERFAGATMTPADWQMLAKAALPTMGQYMEWKALWHEAAQAQARANAVALTPEQRTWTFDMLTGQGQFAADQTAFPWGAYVQISSTAIKAWKTLPKKGEASGQLTKIIQGPQEPFSDFVARMTEAAGRIFGDPDQAAPLVEQLIFEQATQECRAAIAPRKNKGLQDWLRACRELGGPLTNAGLAAAILQSQRPLRQGMNRRTCFKCGQVGHLKKDCPAPDKDRVSLCSRCSKGYHKASQCRSVRDIKGRLLPPPEDQHKMDSKNVRVGPRSQGPQKYGNKVDRGQGKGEKVQSEDTQEWTCTPPPTSY